MSVVSCNIYKLVCRKNQITPLLSSLVTWGGFEPVDPLVPVSEDIYKKNLDRVKQLKKDYENVLLYIQEKQLQNKKKKPARCSEKKIQETINNLTKKNNNLKTLATLLKDVQTAEQDLASYQERLKTLMPLLDKLAQYDIPLFTTNELFATKLASLPSELAPVFEEEVDQNKDIDCTELFKNDEEHLYLLVFSARVKKNRVTDLINKHNGQEVVIFESLKRYTPKRLREEIVTKKNRLKKQYDQMQKKVDAYYRSNETDLQCTADVLDYEEKVLETYQYVGYYAGSERTEKVKESSLLPKGKMYQIEGWVSPYNKDELFELVKSIDENILIEESNPLAHEEIRTTLHNPAFLKPFEAITRLMGVPSPKEIDPTPFFSPFFILFFGFALGDAGYGIVMSAILVALLFKGGFSEQMMQGLYLLLYCAVSTIFFGILMGSWFGVQSDAIAGSVGLFLASLKRIDVQGSIMLVLVGSLIVGFLQQIFALILYFATQIKNKDYTDAFTDTGTWIVLLAAIGIKIGAGVGYPEISSDMANQILIYSFIVFVIGQGWKTKPRILAPLRGVASLFNITGFLSNTLSYARLIALALATSVIASVVNLLATLFGNTQTIGGIIIFVFVLVLGHTFNVALNLLGTFINVLRLQLVEFFPRFYTAKGVEITPIKFKTHYSHFPKNMRQLDLKV